jgi:Shedu protein SduA, C-terminal
MPYRRWEEAVKALRHRSGPASDDQRALAAFLGLTLTDDIPNRVAAAILQRRLSDTLALRPSVFAREHTPSYVESLATELNVRITTPLDGQDVKDAWVRTLWDLRAIRALERLQIEEGDLVAVDGATDVECDIVASISADGRVNFRGGLGRIARPDRLRVVGRRTDTGEAADRLRAGARNRAALRQRVMDVSRAMVAEIVEYRITDPISAEDVAALEETLAEASDERQLQALFTARPVLLSGLLGSRQGAYVIPHPQLANQYVPDFLIATVDSAGLHWYLVELQSPTATFSVRAGRDYSSQVREALAQIEDWREWLTSNVEFARRARRQQGLGLPAIRPESPGIVLVGRRNTDEDRVADRRLRTSQDRQIVIHTYDWLVDAAYQAAYGTARVVYGPLEVEFESFEQEPF